MSGSEFFARNGLLFRSTDDVGHMTQGLGQAAPLIGTLVNDPSLRGLTRALSLALVGVQNRMIKLDTLARPLSMAAATIETALAGRPATFSWQELLNGKRPTPADLRRFIEVRPVLDFSALEPGRTSSNAIRKAVSDLQLAPKKDARVRLTGRCPWPTKNSRPFNKVLWSTASRPSSSCWPSLWLALKSARIILAVFINLFVGCRSQPRSGS